MEVARKKMNPSNNDYWIEHRFSNRIVAHESKGWEARVKVESAHHQRVPAPLVRRPYLALGVDRCRAS